MNSQFIQSISINWDRIGRDSYLRDIEAIRGMEQMVFKSPITFFVGENGSGKSTLLEATYDSHSELYDALRVFRGIHKPGWGYFLRAESFYNVATMEMDYADERHPSERYHEKSHGESFLAIAQRHLRPNGLYLLDEPEAALSPQRQLTLLMEIWECARQESQFFIVTHSPILLGIPDAEIWTFDDGPVHRCSYEETDSYQVTEMFINSREYLPRI